MRSLIRDSARARARGMAALVAVAVLVGCTVDADVGRLERCALGIHSRAIDAVEAELGGRFALERTFHHWDDVFPTDAERASTVAGRSIVASFNGKRSSGDLSFTRIADPDDGEIAADLAAMAARVRAFGDPIFLVFHDEADNDRSFGTPAEFVAAWRRVVDAFRAAGADNVIWVWSASAKAFPSEADAWYPGDDYVDWIGATGFNWYNAEPASPWRTFASVFASFFDWSSIHPRPLMIVSTAVGENPTVAPGDAQSKPTWIREALATIVAEPRLQGVVWFAESLDEEYRDWRVDSSAAALVAFRALFEDPHFDLTGRAPP